MRFRGTVGASLFAIFCLSLTALAGAELKVGVSTGDITPPLGTPSAGYGDRRGQGMTGVHDPLLATAMVIDNGEKPIALVGVDHLGFNTAMVERIKKAVAESGKLPGLEIYVGSSHTHAGGGAYLDVPGIGTMLAGKYDPAAVTLYVDNTVKAILEAIDKREPAKIGIGYSKADGLNGYRGDWPPNVPTVTDVAVIKATRPDGSPLAVLFNFAAHPTVLSGRNMEFSADYVGYARTHAQKLIGGNVHAVFFQGAQADVSPRPPAAEGGEGDGFARCDAMGKALAEAVKQAWDAAEVSDTLKIETAHAPYKLDPKPPSSGMPIVLPPQATEINLIVLNDKHAFVTVPGEMSCIYDADVKRFGGWLGFEHVSILGLTNDAHGYIVLPESWRHQTYESTVSFGGELYGEIVQDRIQALLHALEPDGAYQADRVKPSIVLAPAAE